MTEHVIELNFLEKTQDKLEDFVEWIALRLSNGSKIYDMNSEEWYTIDGFSKHLNETRQHNGDMRKRMESLKDNPSISIDDRVEGMFECWVEIIKPIYHLRFESQRDYFTCKLLFD